MAIREATYSVIQNLGSEVFDEKSAASMLKYIAAMDNLDKAQQNASLSALGLSKAQRQNIADLYEGALATQKLTIAEIAGGNTQRAAELATALNVKTTDQLTLSMLRASGAIDKLTHDQQEQILMAYRQAAANTSVVSSTNKMKGGFLTAFKSMGATGWISLAISAIPLLIKGITWLYDTIVTTSDEYYEMFEEAKSAVSATEEEIEGLNQQISDNKERIEELIDLADDGKISLVEQEELDRLKESNAELSRSIALKKQQMALDAQEANENLANAYGKERIDISDVALTNLRSEIEDYRKVNEELISKYINYTYGGASKAVVFDSEEELEAAVEVYNKYLSMQDEFSKTQNQQHSFADAIEIISNTYAELNEKKEAGLLLTEAEAAALDDAKNQLVRMANDLDTKYIQEYIGEDEQLAEWKALYDGIDKLLNFEEYVSGKLETLPDNIKNALSAMAADGIIGGEEISEYAQRVGELDEWMSKAGITADELAKYLTKVARSAAVGGANGIYIAEVKPLAEVSEQYEKILEVMNSALAEMALSGKVSGETIGSLAELTDDYNDYLYVENGLLKINTDKLKELAGTQFADQTDELEKNGK